MNEPEYVEMPVVKMADAITMRRLLAEAKKYDFNRLGGQLSFDSEGVTILQAFIAFHDRSGNPNVPANDPPHHRCRCLVKVVGDDEPVEMWLDVRASVWDSLPDAPTVRDVIRG